MSTIKDFAETATGCNENPSGFGQLFTGGYNDDGRCHPGGDPIATAADAYDVLRAGRTVAVPNAGAGSYAEVFESLGFTEVQDYETMSSAGDWTLVVRDGEGGDFYPAFQTNRYPHFGFEYSVDFEQGAPSFELLCELLA